MCAMESQEYFTWEEGQELTLFGGEELLMSLGSPLEPEVLPPVLYGIKGAVPAPSSLPNSIRAVGCTSLQPPALAGGPPKLLSDDWLDTQLDLHNLLQAPEPVPFSQELPVESPVSYPGSPTCSAQELLDSMCLDPSLDPPLDMALALTPLDLDLSNIEGNIEGPGQDCSQFLAEVLSKLTEYVGQDIPVDGSVMPSLNDQCTLSPVSVDDIESLLSDPSSPSAQAVPSDGPSELELLLTSGQVTPVSQHSSGQVTPSSLASTSFSATSSDSDYVPTQESRSKKQRAKPYSRERQPSDMKERKKKQNKTAALKYREKRRGETDTMFSECDELEDRNKQLKDKVETMTREIQYLKDLMAEVLLARQTKTN